ncbi:MAG: type II secretion system GspH family protein [Clostridia bacterium]|nr:type II secretion system GspH family protein [Clostridia bacterium]
MRLHRVNQKGITISEVIVALAVLGIVSIPISYLFINSMNTNKMSGEQVLLNAIIRTVKENVSNSVKYQDEHHAIYDGVTEAAVKLRDNSNRFYSYNDIYIDDINGKRYYGYTFDASFVNQAGDVLTSPPGFYTSSREIVAYDITIKKHGKPIRKFRVENNLLNPASP